MGPLESCFMLAETARATVVKQFEIILIIINRIMV